MRKTLLIVLTISMIGSSLVGNTVVKANALEIKTNKVAPIIEAPERSKTYYCSTECYGHEIWESDYNKKLPVCETQDGSFKIDMTFVGDCLLATNKDGYYEGSFSWYAKNKEPKYFLEKAYDTFSKDDFTIVNLENVLTDNNLKAVHKNYSPAFWFKAPTENAEILSSSSVEVVSLENNHTMDYGTKGKEDTIEAIEKVGLTYGDRNKTVYLEKNGFKIAIIFNGLWYEGQSKEIINKINEASKQSDYQVVYYHGGKEKLHKPEEWKVRESHKIVDAGADLVIGNHPHVLQPTEVYNGVNIVYSLGNFSFGGNRKPENRTIIYKMELTVKKNEVISEKAEIIPYNVYTGVINNWQPAPITDEKEKQQVLDFMAGKVSKPYI